MIAIAGSLDEGGGRLSKQLRRVRTGNPRRGVSVVLVACFAPLGLGGVGGGWLPWLAPWAIGFRHSVAVFCRDSAELRSPGGASESRALFLSPQRGDG